MNMKNYLIVFLSLIYIYVFHRILNFKYSFNKHSFCTPIKTKTSEVEYYKQSHNRLHHYEFRYELNQQNSRLNQSRLMILLTGLGRSCIDWWDFSVGESILSQMRSSGFSILAICTAKKDYQVSTPIQTNLNVYWIYHTLQIWIHDIYYKHFQHYPQLYLYGVSRGSHIGSLLSRVLPIQAQIFYIHPGDHSSFLLRSDHYIEMQNRLSNDPTFANWFYFDYCSKQNDRCPFSNSEKNYFYPVPPTYFVHLQNDKLYHLKQYTKTLSDIKNDAFRLGSTLLTHNDTLKLYITRPLNITREYMKENFNKWFCKPWASQFFYEHFINSSYNTDKIKLRTCWCMNTNFIYFDQYPNIAKQDQYVKDIKRYRQDFCEIVCGNILATHAMSSRHVENTIRWINQIDHYRFQYKIQDFLNRPLRLWMYNKIDLIHNKTYLNYQPSMKSSCGRNYRAANEMYSIEYFLQDYFQYLNQSYPLTRHNLLWAKDPLLADYYIIPHDYSCIALDFYRANLTDFEYRSFHIRLNQDYFLPLINNVRTLFPYWNMTLGSNHIIPFTTGKNMGIIHDNITLEILKHTIQLCLSGILPENYSSLYIHRNISPIYRHNYDIIVPPFNRLQWMNTKPLVINSYNRKKYLLFFAGTINNSNSLKSVRKRLVRLTKEDIRKGTKFDTIFLIDGLMSSEDYIESIGKSIFNLCPEGFSPWSPRLYESICFGAIPLILAESIVLPFERFIDWRSFSTKINVSNVDNMIDIIMNIKQFEDYVKEKLVNAITYFHAFRWPYSSVNSGEYDRHLFLLEEDFDGMNRNVFYYLSRELRCRRLEQFYGLDFDSFSMKASNAKRQTCTEHPIICPCYDDERILALKEFI